MNSEHKKILIITPFFSPNSGGVETFLDDLILYLNENNEFVDVYTYSPLTHKEKVSYKEEKNGNTIYRIPYPQYNLFYKLEKVPFLRFAYLSLGLLLFCLIRLFVLGEIKRYKCINTNGLAAAFIGHLISLCANNRFVLTLHTNYRMTKDSSMAKMTNKFTKNVDYIMALSQEAENNLISVGINKNKIILYHHWVDAELFHIRDKTEARKKLNLDANDFIALFVGRFTPEKGIKEVLDSAKYIDKSVKVILIGGGIFDEQATKTAQKHENVSYLGKRSPEEVAQYTSAADVLLYAPVDEDYLGRTSIQSLYSGTPILLPSVSKYFETEKKVIISIPQTVGQFFTPTPKKIAEKLNSLAKEKQTKGKLDFVPEDCFKYAHTFYSKDVNAKKFLTAFVEEATAL